MRPTLLLGLLFATSACATDRSVPSGPLEVRTLDVPHERDATRQRDVPLQVVYPVRAGRYPLVVASHGAGGNRSSFSYQAADLAS
ncbi:MAG: hypothetical protein KDD82_03310, partial [Planctomycetes bacterium]|nr:hypothetical protein [Planctomycetota bacterium]